MMGMGRDAGDGHLCGTQGGDRCSNELEIARPGKRGAIREETSRWRDGPLREFNEIRAIHFRLDR